ncbi:MAG: DNA translocase FtsK, partial [Christensenellaceae bacterium]|nr:DNA translocase FtsK [Christensenellaceae bacterium]
NWAVNEMLARYKQFADRGVKDLERFNQHPDTPAEHRMPKIVIIIDELADLMMASGKEVEDSICRIAQLGRASGIHIVIATQSPRVDIITGLIKANFPSRIALTVSNNTDSRVILDMGGAEKLLKNGDMLYMPGGINKPLRVQGCYIADEENEAVVEYLSKRKAGSRYDEKLASEVEKGVTESGTGSGSGSDSGFGDEMLFKAIELALEYEQVSISMLQRRLHVGYARAARMVDELEEKKIVSPADGSKPRQVLITWEDYHRMTSAAEGEEEEMPWQDEEFVEEEWQD